MKPQGYPETSGQGAWAAFLPSQAMDAILAYITQPAHAALAGRLAATLNGQLFDEVPDEIIETIGSHDGGWSEIDLTALENAEHTRPASFISTSSAIAVHAWRRSINEAETKSPLSAYVVRSHFCLLAPRDEDVEHLFFRKEEEARLQRAKADLKEGVDDLENFVALLGFCDLLSLHLCSGWHSDFGLPLAHPAHPCAKDAGSIAVSINEGVVHLNGTNISRGASVYVNGWERRHANSLQNQRHEWIFR